MVGVKLDMFSFQRYKYYPDILTFSKSFGGGKSSISGYIAKDHVFKKAYGNKQSALLHTSTYNGFAEDISNCHRSYKYPSR